MMGASDRINIRSDLSVSSAKSYVFPPIVYHKAESIPKPDRDITAKMKSLVKLKSVVETNLLEEDIKKVAVKGDTISTPIGHYEIKTFKVVF